MGLRFWKTREFGTAIVLVSMLLACEAAARARTGSSYLFSDSVLRLFQESSFIGIATIYVGVLRSKAVVALAFALASFVVICLVVAWRGSRGDS